jgi:hypothetical protein
LDSKLSGRDIFAIGVKPERQTLEDGFKCPFAPELSLAPVHVFATEKIMVTFGDLALVQEEANDGFTFHPAQTPGDGDTWVSVAGTFEDNSPSNSERSLSLARLESCTSTVGDPLLMEITADPPYDYGDCGTVVFTMLGYASKNQKNCPVGVVVARYIDNPSKTVCIYLPVVSTIVRLLLNGMGDAKHREQINDINNFLDQPQLEAIGDDKAAFTFAYDSNEVFMRIAANAVAALNVPEKKLTNIVNKKGTISTSCKKGPNAARSIQVLAIKTEIQALPKPELVEADGELDWSRWKAGVWLGKLLDGPDCVKRADLKAVQLAWEKPLSHRHLFMRAAFKTAEAIPATDGASSCWVSPLELQHTPSGCKEHVFHKMLGIQTSHATKETYNQVIDQKEDGSIDIILYSNSDRPLRLPKQLLDIEQDKKYRCHHPGICERHKAPVGGVKIIQGAKRSPTHGCFRPSHLVFESKLFNDGLGRLISKSSEAESKQDFTISWTTKSMDP